MIKEKMHSIKNISCALRLLFVIPCSLFVCSAHAASVVATVGGRPITDADITARVGLMTKQGNTATNNRKVALQNIIDDYVKLDYAANFNVKPTAADIRAQMDAMNIGELSSTEKAMAESAMTANIAWQMIVARTILPTVEISNADIASERNALARERGLPIEMTIIRLTDIPVLVAGQLTKPASCDDAMAMAEKFGGAPQKFTALQYEMTEDIRNRVANLEKLTWSPVVDGSVLLVCDSKRGAEYGELDQMIKQNATFKAAMFKADQQLKQLRRKAVVVINDERYKF
jgi:hypothetical protein